MPVLVDPDVGAGLAAVLVEVLQGPVERRVELVAHEQAAELPWELRAEAAVAALREAAHERRRDRRELVLGEAPVAARTGQRRARAGSQRGGGLHPCYLGPEAAQGGHDVCQWHDTVEARGMVPEVGMEEETSTS